MKRILFVCTMGIAGCAHVYVDANGTKHIVGLVHVRLPVHVDSKQVTEEVKISNVGFLFAKTELETSIGFGYNRMSLMALPNDACVAINPNRTNWISRDIFSKDGEEK